MKLICSQWSTNGQVWEQRYRNTTYPGRHIILYGLRVAIVEAGVLINGNYGTNPSTEEMSECLEVFRQVVKAWDTTWGTEPAQEHPPFEYERYTTGAPCPQCNGYADRVRGTPEEHKSAPCGMLNCCSAVFVCRVCGKRWAVRLPAPDID